MFEGPAEGNDDDFYSQTLETVGYNRLLELDEAVPFVIFVFAKKLGVISDFRALPIDDRLVREVHLLSVLQFGILWVPTPKIATYKLTSGIAVSFAARNEGSQPVTVIFDCTRLVFVACVCMCIIA